MEAEQQKAGPRTPPFYSSPPITDFRSAPGPITVRLYSANSFSLFLASFSLNTFFQFGPSFSLLLFHFHQISFSYVSLSLHLSFPMPLFVRISFGLTVSLPLFSLYITCLHHFLSICHFLIYFSHVSLHIFLSLGLSISPTSLSH